MIRCLCGARFDVPDRLGVARLDAVQAALRGGWREDGVGDFWKCPRCAALPAITERVHDVSEMRVGDRAVRFCDACRGEHEFTCFFIMPGGVRVGRARCEKLGADCTQLLAIDYPAARAG